MRISSLEISGFKSFHRKTRIEFRPGSNGIVGPNGCGKSNVIDAVRWVIGEQNPRMLRADSTEDLISDGTVSLKPVGMAEVKMVLTDMPGKGGDVSIMRRYYRDGESEYSINGVACRLKDIVDIFMDTGAGARSHSIIGQGEVERFITAKPEEKRALIEEVAGIVRYKARRKETWSKLKQTEENLDRIRDMSKDARRRRENLKRQAEQAEKLNSLSEEAARLELLMLGAQRAESEEKILEATQKKAALDESVREIESEKNGIANRLRSIEDEAQSLDGAVSSADSEILAVREKINGVMSSRDLSAGRRADIEELLGRLENEKLSLERQARDVREQISQTRSDIENTDGRLEEIRSGFESAEAELESLRDGTRVDRDGLEDIRNSFFGAVEKCDLTETSYRELTGELERLSVKSGYLSEQKESLLEEKKKLSSQRESFLSQAALISDAQAESEKQREDLRKNLGSFNKEHEKLLGDITSLKERRGECVSRLEALSNIQKSFEWLPESSRQFLLEGKTGGIVGILSDYVNVPPEYAKAFEAALDERLGWIVVGTGDDASRAIGKLRRSEAGRATFVPVDRAVPRKKTSSPDAPRGSRPISNVVSMLGRGEEVMREVLEGIFVVDTLSDAFECAAVSQGLSFATMEGDFLDSSGAVSGGWTTGGVFQRKSEIEQLTREVGKLDKKIKSSLEKAENFEVRMEDFRSEMSVLDERMQTDRVKLGSLERDLEGFAFTLEGKESKLKETEAASAAVAEEFETKTRQSAQCREKLDNLHKQRDSLRKKLSEFEEKTAEIERRENALAGRLGSLKVEIASLEQNRENSLRAVEGLVRREEEISGRIGEISAEMRKKSDEKNEMQNSSDKAETEITGLEALLEEKRRNLEKIREKRGGIFSNARDLRDSIEGLDGRIESMRARRGDFEIGLKTMENNIEYVSAKIAEITGKSGVKMPAAEEIESADFEETKTALENLKGKIDRFGLVNLLAPEEYEEAEKKHDFLETQVEDLEKSAASLKKSISRLDRESSEKFTEAFNEVDSKFRELFPTLFKGGEGKLVMTNPGDPFETGIDIVVKPGGKKYQNISLLSGGEKALSAIAFIISSCLVRPLPFLILDEIDAPLDDSNTGRFSALMKDISRNSQVLVVTHNKTTIADVDALIGITASKAANSAVVSVDLAKAV